MEGVWKPAQVPPLFACFIRQDAACRFMGIAEQMGKVLQRTSISVNIKERLDFSCALFGPDGSLVSSLRVATEMHSQQASLEDRILQRSERNNGRQKGLIWHHNFSLLFIFLWLKSISTRFIVRR